MASERPRKENGVMADPDLQPTPRRSPRLQQLLENRSCGVITKEDAMKAGEPPKLYKFKQPGTRGPTSLPAIWFKSMSGQDWDGSYEEQSCSYEKQRAAVQRSSSAAEQQCVRFCHHRTRRRAAAAAARWRRARWRRAVACGGAAKMRA
jgi:hypothetical protein